LNKERAMSKRGVITVYVFVSIVLVLVGVKPAAAYVTPQIGGGQVGSANAPMIMLNIKLDGTNVEVLDTFGNPWTTLTWVNSPVLRPLTGTDAFNPVGTAYYNALNGTAYNWQYGWDNTYFATGQSSLPAGTKIFIEMTSQSDGLNTYARNSYTPIFGTGGTSNIWQWNETMSMSHNAYTVMPGYGNWTANYTVYLGDATTKAALPGYTSSTVTLSWTSIPEPATMAFMGTGLICLLGTRRKHKAAA
jgi:hypothetical protein